MPGETMSDDAAPPRRVAETAAKNPNYTAVFAAELIELARTDRRIVAITAGCRPARGWQSSRRLIRIVSSTSGSRSSTR
jgi:deoxyxylulose-5-phosphate synthase